MVRTQSWTTKSSYTKPWRVLSHACAHSAAGGDSVLRWLPVTCVEVFCLQMFSTKYYREICCKKLKSISFSPVFGRHLLQLFFISDPTADSADQHVDWRSFIGRQAKDHDNLHNWCTCSRCSRQIDITEGWKRSSFLVVESVAS